MAKFDRRSVLLGGTALAGLAVLPFVTRALAEGTGPVPGEFEVTHTDEEWLAILGPEFNSDRIERWGRDFGRDLGRDLGRELGRREFYFDMPNLRNFEFNFGTRSRIGVGVSELTPQLSEYFGVRDGVLVTSVDADSAAGRAR